MKLIDLFCMCDNLGYGSRIVIKSEYGKFANEGSYPEMQALYGEKIVYSFEIVDEHHAIVHMKGV